MAEAENGPDSREDTLSSNDSPRDAASDDASESGGTAELTKKNAELDALVAQLRDQLLRKAAEFENYKKRTEAESLSVIRFANEDLLMKLLPVVDDFERSFRALGKPGGQEGEPAPGDIGKREAAFIGGVEMIRGKLQKTLEQVGLKPFVSVGQPFDPEFHDALLQVQRDDVPHHTVIEEIDRGYQLNDRVIRHARVIVSSKPGSADQ